MTTPERTDSTEPDPWVTHARCRGLDAAEFFPDESIGVDHAQHICIDCPVRVECLNYALEHHINHGIWGGTSQRERHRLLQHRRPHEAPSS